MHDGVWTGRLILAGFLSLSLSAPQAVIILRETAERGTATPALSLCMPNNPPHRQDHHKPLPHSFSTAYSYSMYTNHSLFSNVFELAALTRHSRNNVCSDTKSISRATGFAFYLEGRLRPWQKVQCWRERGPSWFPLLHRLANVQWSAWVNNAGRKKGLIDDRNLLGQMCLNCPKMSLLLKIQAAPVNLISRKYNCDLISMLLRETRTLVFHWWYDED